MMLVLLGLLVLGVVHCQDASTDRVAKLEQTVNNLARQVMLQQLFVEERIRSDGRSGLKQIRHNKGGTRPYFYESYTLDGVCQIHDHSNNELTIGLGEFIAVLNGLEFRTRHNDYPLKMPSTTSGTYHETEFIPFPDVPPSVLEKTTIEEQIVEMREYFRAFKKQDTNIRDYKPYFKPVLCYLEGAWQTNTETLDEPFDSDRHHIAASSWFDLQEKLMYTSKTGLKDSDENYAYLPTTIVDVVDGEPIYAQWNYRILCHPVEKEINLDRLRPVDDLAPRVARDVTLEEYTNSRAARFNMNGRDSTYRTDKKYQVGLMDDIMEEIPGKDNYQGVLRDESFGQTAYRMRDQDELLNAARYHRSFISKVTGANGQNVRNRGFSDDNLYVALTSQPNVAEVSVNDCATKGGVETCAFYSNRVSYAIPLELVFLTPLLTWNPYDIAFSGQWSADGQLVTANGRNGGLTPETAWNGNHRAIYYRTPYEFYSGEEVGTDPADTCKPLAGVLDKNGELRLVTASGTKIILPEIEGVGLVRTRYPVMPIHAEGSAVWRELEAVKEMLMKLNTYKPLLHEQPNFALGVDPTLGMVHLRVQDTCVEDPGHHHHEVYLSAEDFAALADGVTSVEVYTTQSMQHQHLLEIYYDIPKSQYRMKTCDGSTKVCWDKHYKVLLEDGDIQW